MTANENFKRKSIADSPQLVVVAHQPDIKENASDARHCNEDLADFGGKVVENVQKSI
jgi:hypothetical protein